MTCSDARPHLSALLDSAGEAGDREATARHVGSCPSCRAELDTLSAADRALKTTLTQAALRSAPPGYFDDFSTRLIALLEEKPVAAAPQAVAHQGDPEIDDLRMLAAATIRRSSEITVPQLPLAMMSSTSLSQVVLPMTAPQLSVGASRSVASDMPALGEPPRRKARMGWVVGAGATVAAGAVAVFLLMKQGGERPAPLPPRHDNVAAVAPQPTVQEIPPPVVEPMTMPASAPSAVADNVAGSASAPASEPTAAVPAATNSDSPASGPSAPSGPSAAIAAATPPAAVVVPATPTPPPGDKVPASLDKADKVDKVAEKAPDKSADQPGGKTSDKGAKSAASASSPHSDAKADVTKPEMKPDPVPDAVKPDPVKSDTGKDTAKKDEPPKPPEPGPSVGAPGAPTGPPDPKKKVDLPSAEELLKEVNAPPVPPTEAGAAPGKPAEPSGPRHERLSQEEISSAMESVTSEAQACGVKATETGMVTVSIKIKPDGSVADANPTGKSAGTDVGSCVAGVVKHAKFVPFDGAAMTIRYGFRVEKQDE